MNILIRTSGGKAPKKELGFGHIYRCINLADYLKPNKIHFLVEDYGGAKKIFRERGYKKIYLLRKTIDLNSDINETITFINKNKIDIVIVDKYDLNPQYVKVLRKLAKIVIISDLQNIEYPADLVINGFIGFKNQITYNKHGTKCLLGPAYQILNKEFMKRKRKIKKTTLLATFGGFDEQNIVDVLLSALVNYVGKIKIKIILGPGTVKSRKITTYEKKYKYSVKIISKTRTMFKEISNAEFGMCSGGITTYEFAALNVPFAIISQVKHQLMTAKEWQKKGRAFNLGLVNNNTQERIEGFLKKIATKKLGSKLKKSLIDGFGVKRAAQEILRLK